MSDLPLATYSALDDMIETPTGNVVSIEAATTALNHFIADALECHADLVARDLRLASDLVNAIRDARAYRRPTPLFALAADLCGMAAPQSEIAA